MSRRVAVTGIGVVAPGGIGVPAFWELLAEGRTATRGHHVLRPDRSEVPDRRRVRFRPHRPRPGRRAGRAGGPERIQFALVAGAEAVRDSGLDLGREDPWRVGVSLGTAVGGTTRLEHDYVLVSHRGQRWDVDHTEAEPQLHRAFSPSTVALRGGGTFRRPGVRCRPSPPAAPPAWTPSATPSTPSRKAGPTYASQERRTPRSPRSPWPASTRSRPRSPNNDDPRARLPALRQQP